MWRSQTTVRQLGFGLLRHPPYSPDLSPCNFLRFPVMKTYLRRIHFGDTHEHSASVQVAISNIQLNSFRCSVESGLERCRKCTSFYGEYFEMKWALLADHAQENDSQTSKSPYWIVSKRRGSYIEKSVPRDHSLASFGKPRDAKQWSAGRIIRIYHVRGR